MPRQGLPGLTAAKVQQKNELTKYFGKKVQILYKKRYNDIIEGELGYAKLLQLVREIWES